MNPQSDTIEVIGIGTPAVDLILQVSNQYLSTVEGGKGGATFVDYETLQRVIADTKTPPIKVAGGSAANTIKGLAHLGHRCALIGKIGNDSNGVWFQNKMKSLRITPKFVICKKLHTREVVCLITPDGERTMRAFSGAGTEFKHSDLTPEMFHKAKLVHIEGYTLSNEGLTVKAMALAKQAGAKVSFDLASFEMTKKYKSSLIDILNEYVDILFANETETHIMTHHDPEHGCEKLMQLCETVVVLHGLHGCWIGQKGRKIHTPAFAARPIDTTGAGDLFASGFLHGYLKGLEIEQSGRFGSLVGAAAVHTLGTEISEKSWEEIKYFLSRGI